MANIYISQKLASQKREARKQFLKDVISGTFGVMLLSVMVVVFSVVFLGL